MTKENEVGYGKPPKSGQWKPGQSGNPKGRRKRGAAFLFEAAGILSEPVSAKTPAGGSVRLAALEAAYLAMCRKALKGDGAALYQAINIMLEVLLAGEAASEKRAAECRGAKRRLAVMIGLPEDEYPGPD